MSTKVKKRKGIQSVEIGLTVLDALSNLGRPSSLSEIAKASRLSPSQAHRYLASFVNMQYLRQDQKTSLYDLHTGVIRIGLAGLARLDIFEEASRIAQAFAETTGRTTLLSIWSELGPTIIRWFPGSPPVYTSLAIGSRLSMTRSAAGRVFLAFQNRAYISKFLQKEMAQAHKGRRADLESLRNDVRKRMLAKADGVLIPGLRAIAAPVFDLQGELALVIAAVASEGSAESDDPVVEKQLIDSAKELTARIGGRWPAIRD